MGKLYANKEFYEITNMTEEETIPQDSMDALYAAAEDRNVYLENSYDHEMSGLFYVVNLVSICICIKLDTQFLIIHLREH